MFRIDAKSKNLIGLLFHRRQKKEVTVDELIVFTTQILALFKAGFTLSSAVSIIAEQTENEKMLDALLGIRLVLEKGGSLSKAIEEYRDIFPDYYITNIYAAEVSGVLQATLSRLLSYLKGEKELKQHLRHYLFYPKIVLSMIISGSIILATVQGILPIGIDLLLLAAGITCAYLLIFDSIKSLFAKGTGREIWDRMRLRIWILGPVYRDFLNRQFAGLFNSLFNAGLSIVDVFYFAGDAIPNTLYGREIRAIGARLDGEMPLGEAIDLCPYFPYQLKSIFHIGAQSGEFEENLIAFARQKDMEIAYKLKKIFQISYIVILIILLALVMMMRSYFMIAF